MMTTLSHTPVMLDEVLSVLDPEPGMTYVDATIGGGGHAVAVAERIGPRGRVIGIDRDPWAIEAAARRLSETGVPFALHHGRFSDLERFLAADGVPEVDLLLADLGVSSAQLDDDSRGFSYSAEVELDMRMDPTDGETAAQLIARLSEPDLEDIMVTYGEERYARRIAREIVRTRRLGPVTTTDELTSIIRRAVPPEARRGSAHPARRTFQALRIAVNQELAELEGLLSTIPNVLKLGGRATVLAFHSLEDRPVKRAFMAPTYRRLTSKPLRATEEEVGRNRRARSAKLRAVERVQ
ncbi:MAG: 16S rRNA (cytosine(1402)-N(4))-methyltransferase RsmH [Sulfobacillus sp.]